MSIDWAYYAAATCLGLGLSIWVTSIWRDSFKSGTNPNLPDLFKKLVLFLLVGTIPSVIRGLTSTANQGGNCFAFYCIGVGIGWILGWIFIKGERPIIKEIRPQYRFGGSPPSTLEVWAIATLEGADKAQEITGLDGRTFTKRFEAGADEARPLLTGASEYQRAVFTRVFNGDPIAAIARDVDKTPLQVARDFAQLFGSAKPT